MNATEKRIREIAVLLINAQTVNGIVETMTRIATLIDGYSEPVASYFKGLYEYIDGNDRAFQPLTDDQKYRVQNIGARLLVNRESIVIAFVRLHNMLEWVAGNDAMIALTDKLYDTAESEGYPIVKFDD